VYGQAAGALTCQPGDVSAVINQWQSGPCGPPLWPLRAMPPTDSIDAMRLLVIDVKACLAEASEKHAEENRPGVL